MSDEPDFRPETLSTVEGEIDGGTGEQGDVAVIREALDDMNYGHEGDAYASLAWLAAALERAERDGGWMTARAEAQLVNEEHARAEKAERALAEMRDALEDIAGEDDEPDIKPSWYRDRARAALRSEKASDES